MLWSKEMRKELLKKSPDMGENLFLIDRHLLCTLRYLLIAMFFFRFHSHFKTIGRAMVVSS